MKISKLLASGCLLLIFLSIILISCNKNDKSISKSVSAENTALKLIKALKDNDFETFKTLFINENELATAIKNLAIDEEQKKQYLNDFQNHNAEVATSLLTKEAFSKFRTELEDKYGDKFWTNVKILENPEIINTNDEFTKFSEAEVNYKLLLDADTLQLPLKTFYEQKNGWKFSGLIRVLTNNQDPNVEEDDDESNIPNDNIDTSKGVKEFEKEFQSKPPLDEDEE